ncbi:MAG: hypothetical protein JKY37_19150 [Nannocystaceae bacterium]|nr:hypothetical protein [Nannocystaceae bacterium]
MDNRLAGSLVLAVSLFACSADDSSADADTGGASTGTPMGSDSGSTGAMSGAGSTENDPSTTEATDSTGGPSSDGPADSSSGGDGSTEGSGTTGAAGPTWDNFGEAFFESYCWECHGAGDPMRDYSVLANIVTEAAAIRCGTSSVAAPADNCDGSFPPEQFPVGGGQPSDEERALLVAWVDAGLPEN